MTSSVFGDDNHSEFVGSELKYLIRSHLRWSIIIRESQQKEKKVRKPRAKTETEKPKPKPKPKPKTRKRKESIVIDMNIPPYNNANIQIDSTGRKDQFDSDDESDETDSTNGGTGKLRKTSKRRKERKPRKIGNKRKTIKRRMFSQK